MSKKKEKSMYDEMVEKLSVFVIRTSSKDNPIQKERSELGLCVWLVDVR